MMNQVTGKLAWIEENIGLEASYGGGYYTVTIWNNMDGEYDFVYCKSNTDIPHERETVSPQELEAKARAMQPDLRKWRKVDYDAM